MTKLYFILIIITIFISCNPETILPPETKLEYDSYSLMNDSSGNAGITLFYKFQDGDNNIGLTTIDKLLPPYNKFPYNYNFFIDIYDKNDSGVFVPMKNHLTDSVIHYYYSIEPFDITGSLKGTLKFTVNDPDFSGIQMLSKNNVILFKAYMLDRDLTSSNIAESEEISITGDN